ncbi:MAG: lysylphosphatidylglycerol synthase transmembrane domain-containing protein [Algibacter sp.]|uniref:lysylphosphatidylglycerol synthase transmembrane domain-containing protein n=1 Tax=Algibacter sp. TaxID=1872428 RepID=UPI002616C2C4|nr:lysylphosphatidylglycerol synthase transmembrane domain-containing protein [Algibacter sp.]MDG1728927.1 lysylphosphatidylglycerol synthase transmembrane domain-containing protein [Algibacter sp.]
MNSKQKSILKISIPILLSIVAIWYSFSIIPIENLISSFKEANYTYVLIGALLGLLSHLSRAYRWRFQLEPMGYKIKLGNSVMAVFAAYLINYTIPRAGEVARASVLTNYEGIPFEKSFGTIVSERIADMVVMLGIIFVTLLLQFDFIYEKLSESISLYKITITAVSIVIIVMILTRIIQKGNSKIILKIKSFVNGLLEGVLSIFKMKKKWLFIFHTLFIWSMYVLMFYVTSFSIPETSDIPFAAILVGFILASFSIAATNGGIGSYPLAIYAAFSIFNIPEDPSIAFGWIMWTSQTLMIMFFGGLSLLYLPFYNRKISKTNF